MTPDEIRKISSDHCGIDNLSKFLLMREAVAQFSEFVLVLKSQTDKSEFDKIFGDRGKNKK